VCIYIYLFLKTGESQFLCHNSCLLTSYACVSLVSPVSSMAPEMHSGNRGEEPGRRSEDCKRGDGARRCHGKERSKERSIGDQKHRVFKIHHPLCFPPPRLSASRRVQRAAALQRVQRAATFQRAATLQRVQRAATLQRVQRAATSQRVKRAATRSEGAETTRAEVGKSVCSAGEACVVEFAIYISLAARRVWG
jgi:hypothetical protein